MIVLIIIKILKQLQYYLGICSIIETTIISFLFVLQSKSPSNSNLFVQYKNRTILSFKKSYFNIIKSILNK